MRNLLRNIVDKLARLVRWIVTRPYKEASYKVARKMGHLFHWLLFDVILRSRLQGKSKKDVYTIIFKADTPAGKRFDLVLLVAILVNVVVMIFESFSVVQTHRWLMVMVHVLEWLFTISFTFEYYLRVWCLKKPMRYVTSFYGVIDLLSILPAYLSLLFPVARTFTVLRLLRLLRIFRILDMDQFVNEGRMLLSALKRSAMKIVIFMLFVYIVAVILGAMMYAAESDKNPMVFSNIPKSIYWAVVTITTVGYGDMTPITPTGRLLAIVVMILGYSIIAVPTGIVAGETIEEHKRQNRKARRKRKFEGVEEEEDEEENIY